MKADTDNMFQIMRFLKIFTEYSQFTREEIFGAVCAFVMIKGSEIGIDEQNFHELVKDWWSRFTGKEVLREFYEELN